MTEEMCITGQLFGTRLVSAEKQRELKARDADLQHLLEHLQRLRPLSRLPLVALTCTCPPTWRAGTSPTSPGTSPGTSPTPSDSDDSSNDPNSDDEESFTLEQVLRAVSLYERKPLTRRSPKTLRNLVCGYGGRQGVDDGHVTKILEMARTADPGVGEAALLLVRQLSARPDNAARFLSQDAMRQALQVLEDGARPHLHQVAAQVVGKLASHVTLGDMWMEFMMTSGLSTIKMRISRQNAQNVRYACAQCLVSLAIHQNMAILILDQATEVIDQIKGINTDFREVYAEILTVLADHNDHTRAAVLNINSLPEAMRMLKEGPCASQRQALVLVSTLAGSEGGLRALLEERALHHVLSALLDSHCRRVRCTALVALHSALSARALTFQKQVLVSVDQFFHEHDDDHGPGALLADGTPERPKFRLDTESRVSRAVGDLCDTVIRMTHKEARLTKDKQGQISEVYLSPGIDVDDTLLSTLTHLAQVMLQLGHLKVNPLKVKGFDLHGNNGEEYRRILRKTFGGLNPVIVRTLVERGAGCFLDVLHTYVLRLHQVAPLPCPPAGPAGLQGHTPLNAWAEKTSPGDADWASLFCEGELKLIRALLGVARMLAMCSCDNEHRDLERDVKDKMEGHDGTINGENVRNNKKNCHKTKSSSDDPVRKPVVFSQGGSGVFWEEETEKCTKVRTSVHTTCQCDRVGSRGRPESHLQDYMDNKATIHGETTDGDTDEDTVTEEGLLFKDQLNRELGPTRRGIRMRLYESGIIESVGPWLVCRDPSIKSIVISTLRSMIQHVPEFIEPRPVIPQPTASDKKARPMSAMTFKERDKALNIALFQMSSQMNSAIKDALGMPPSPPATPRRPAAQKPPANIFTIEEGGHAHTDQTGQNHTATDQPDGHMQLELENASEFDDDDDVGAISWRDNIGEDQYVEGDHHGCAHGVNNDGQSTRQCLSVPKDVHSNNELSVRRDSLKTYTHDDYHRFARRQIRAQSAKPNSARPQSAKPNPTRPQSAKVTLSNRVRPESAKSIRQTPKTTELKSRPQSAKSAIPKIEGPQNAKVTISKSQRPQSAKVTLSTTNDTKLTLSRVRRPQSASTVGRRAAAGPPPPLDKGRPGGDLPPRPPGPDARGPHHCRPTSGPVCVRTSREQLPFRLRSSPGGGAEGKAPGTPVRAGKPPVVKLQVTANVRPSSGRQPFTMVGSKAPQSRPTSASSRPPSAKKALEEVTKKMTHGELPWKPIFDKCEPVRSQCCHRVVEVCGRLLIRDLLSRDVTTRRAAIVFLQEVIRQSEVAVHMKLSECSLVPRLVDYLRVNDENVLEEVLGLMVTRLLVASDRRLQQLFARCGGTELLMVLASSTAGLLRAEVASTLKVITRAPTRQAGSLRRTMSAPVGRTLTNQPVDIWDKIMDRWKEEDKVTAMLRRNSHK